MKDPTPKFFCADCGCLTPTRVLETRDRRRRRECLDCGARFSTIEDVLPSRREPHHRRPQPFLPFDSATR
jgi:hypothetical protein